MERNERGLLITGVDETQQTKQPETGGPDRTADRLLEQFEDLLAGIDESPTLLQPKAVLSPGQTPGLEVLVPKPALRLRIGKLISDFIFYLVLISILLTAFLVSGQEGKPRSWFGYSGFSVLSDSMNSTIPKGSFLVTKAVDPNSLEVDDVITFFQHDGSTVTHRIIQIYEGYNGNLRGFLTQGDDNPIPDKEVVVAVNVIGKVVFHVNGVGTFLTKLRENLWIPAVIAGLVFLLSLCLKIYMGEKKKEQV